jgi:hypothetical protein
MHSYGPGDSERGYCMHEWPTATAGAALVRWVTLILHGPIGELAAALRILADALDQGKRPAPSPAPPRLTSGPWVGAGRDDRQPGRPVRGPAHSSRRRGLGDPVPSAPQVSYEALQADVQAQLGISCDRLGGVLASLIGARKRLPRDVGYPIERDTDLRHDRIEPVRP